MKTKNPRGGFMLISLLFMLNFCYIFVLILLDRRALRDYAEMLEQFSDYQQQRRDIEQEIRIFGKPVPRDDQ